MNAVAGPDEETFEALYRSQWSSLTRLAWLLTGSREIAEDVVHDAFLKVAPLLPTLQAPDQYVRRMVVNGSRDHHRRQRIIARHQPPPAEPLWGPEVDEVWELLVKLPQRQRHAIVLRYYSDLRIDDIADLLACPAGTVKSLIHRGLEQMRKGLER
jgi:RNA polymerase sigma factor (sigma-70 family)